MVAERLLPECPQTKKGGNDAARVCPFGKILRGSLREMIEAKLASEKGNVQ